MPPPPVITLITDFGLSDHYAGTMKGVILQRCPDARIIDITHQIPPFSIMAAAYTVDQSAPYFPGETIHLVVVDPGVGTERKAIVVEALGQYFVGPDNGVFTMILARDPQARVYEVANRDLTAAEVSSTFHGRDVFAPVAGALVNRSVSPKEVGPVVLSPEMLRNLDPLRLGEAQWQGQVLSIDHFGNVITNFRSDAYLALVRKKFELHAGEIPVRTLAATFGEVAPGELCVYPGSSGYLEIGINRDNAARRLGIKLSDSLILNL